MSTVAVVDRVHDVWIRKSAIFHQIVLVECVIQVFVKVSLCVCMKDEGIYRL